ncbi:MAG: hypothetical protein ACMG6E_00155 [Candidatus Roizmanbacteria bacterium]
MKRQCFWLENPGILVSELRLLPRENDSVEMKLNAVTRLVILIAIILALSGWRHWLVFLIVAMVLIIFLYLLNCKLQGDPAFIEHFNEDMTNFEFYKEPVTTNIEVTKCPTYETPLSELYTSIVMPAVTTSKPKVETQRKEKNSGELMREYYLAEFEDDGSVERDRKALFDTTV